LRFGLVGVAVTAVRQWTPFWHMRNILACQHDLTLFQAEADLLLSIILPAFGIPHGGFK
jgi:hypothetical protein